MSEMDDIGFEIDEAALNLKEWNWCDGGGELDGLLDAVIRSISENAFRIIINQIKEDFKTGWIDENGEITLSFLDGIFFKIKLRRLIDRTEDNSDLATFLRNLADEIG